ncbi:MAG: dUTP diphosphatase [Verrucomicrobiaceae bacterium]|nr:dUTP diphosphatase [Verrucomicrobiaceae bacterium]
MKQALITMLTLQDRMNTKVHPQWIDQRYEWFRAIWIECGELMEHYGYKWWKKQTPDIGQVRLEAIDIWHFGLSALFIENKSIEVIADEVAAAIDAHQYNNQDVRTATEALAAFALNTKQFSVPLFWDLLRAVELDFDELYRHYVGKNVLNFFRQDHGYKDGSYQKQWHGREDNEHLMELLREQNSSDESFAENLYQALSARYQTVIA